MLPMTLLMVVTSLSSLKVSKGLLNSWYAAMFPCASYAEYVGLLLRASPITPPMLGRCCLVLFALRFTSTISLSFRNFCVALNLPEYLFRSFVLMIPSWFCKPKEAKYVSFSAPPLMVRLWFCVRAVLVISFCQSVFPPLSSRIPPTSTTFFLNSAALYTGSALVSSDTPTLLL